MEMILVEGGTFMMGADDGYSDEMPVHEVSLSDFYIGKFLVTQKEWEEIMDTNPSHLKGDDLPVERVSWNDVQDFISKLNTKTDKTYRLPTEAEWEFAARGGIKSQGFKYAGSNNLDEVAWYGSNSEVKTHPIGQKKPNELGLYDMSGNIFEWCEDNWHTNYLGAPSTSQAWSDKSRASYRVFRGGGWGSPAEYCRISCRIGYRPSYRSASVGLRLAMSIS